MSQIAPPPPKKKKRPTVPSFDIQAAKKLEEQQIKKEQQMQQALSSLKEQDNQKMEIEQKPAPKVDQKKNMMDKINNLFQKKITTTQTSDNSSKSIKTTTGIQKEYKKSLIHNDEEEYDPSKPNDYEYFKQKIKQKQRGAKSLAQEQKEKKERLLELERKKQQQKLQEEQNYKEILEEEKRLFSLNETKHIQQKQPEKEFKSTEEKALKIMSKFGFKLGKGLGKNEDGITAPIMHMKVSDKVGIMTQGAGDVSSILPQDFKYKNYIEQCGLKASKVIVMLNLVSPNQIDDDLEAEVIEECQIYGNVVKSIVYMMKGQPLDQSVRIFVMFENISSAINGFANIHRRNFDGREIQCVFYDEADFLTNKFDKPLKFAKEPENMEIE